MCCQKYPEDPFVSFKEPWNRLVGNWKVTSYQIRGVEHIHDFDKLLAPETLSECYMSCTKSPSSPSDNGYLTYYYNNNVAIYPSYTGNCQYLFIDKKHISFLTNGLKFYELLFNRLGVNTSDSLQYRIPWEIQELFNKDFHINCDSVDIYFKKQ